MTIYSNSDEILLNTTLKLKKFNLFIGKNGSGKSRTLTNIAENLGVKIIDEGRDLGRKTTYQPYTDLPNSRITSGIYDFDDDSTRSLNEDIKQIFNRTVLNGPYYEQSRIPLYRKGKRLQVPVSSDGKGIAFSRDLLEFAHMRTANSILCVEEVSLGLYPGIVKKFLDILFSRLGEKNMQFFGTSQDVFVSLYFLEKFYDENFNFIDNPDYQIYKFKETEQNGIPKLIAEAISIENEQTFLYELVGDFVGVKEYGLLGLMSNNSSK